MAISWRYVLWVLPYACSYIYIYLILYIRVSNRVFGGFLKLGVPKVTMVVSILKWSNDLDDLRYPYFRKLPCGARLNTHIYIYIFVDLISKQPNTISDCQLS